jgi:hypothetical protein
MLPIVQITKTDGNTGVVRPGADGICAVIGPATAGTQDQAASFGKSKALVDGLGGGLLVESAAWMMQFTQKPVVAVRSAASVAAVLSAVAHTGAGTSVVSASGTPIDDYSVIFKVVAGGTIGVAGATYKFSLDGGKTYTAVRALGTANSLVLLTPTGASTGITLAFAAGTLLADQVETLTATAARLNNADLVAALEALRVSSLRFEHVHVIGPLDATMFATLDAWRLARDGEGRYYTASGNTRFRTLGSETEAQFKTALDGIYGALASTGLVLGADAFDCSSPLSGLTLPRDAALAIVTRGMSIARGVDCAEVRIGPLSGVGIKDERGGPYWHDESIYPGLDDSRFSVFRTFDQLPGTYVCNPNLFSTPGSDYVYWQHMRVMNRACEITKELLTQRLSAGVRKDDANHILEVDAKELDELVSATLKSELDGQVTDTGFLLSRDDDLGSNGPNTLNGAVWVKSLAYAKKFGIEAKFVRTIPVSG